MIIGKELGKELEGFTITVNGNSLSVQNNYGKQDALDKFIAECDKVKAQKFPLIFYVTNPVNDLGNRYECATSIVIMTNTNHTWLSKKRTSETFDKIIHPIYKALIPRIQHSKKLSLTGNRDTRLSFEDFANYGIVKGEIGQKKSTESVVSDYIDARIINLTIQYKK